MKRFVFVTVIMPLIVLSCSKISTDAHDNPDEVCFSVEDMVPSNSIANHVTLKDVHAVISRDYPATKGSSQSYKVTPYMNEKSDTLMYIVNIGNGDGWKIYSSDKRTPPVLAEGANGRFSLDEGNPAVAVWMSCMATDVARVKQASDEELIFSSEDIILNKDFWPAIQTRVPDGPIIVVNPSGHWEETVSSSIVEYDSIEHMVPQWDQDSPYNECCPYYVTTPSSRACAGCVAIAGSQVLYYLHDKLGIPEQMYSQGVCIGNTDGYSRTFSHPTDSIWSSMKFQYQQNSSGMIPEAILIGYVGAQVNMHYHDGAGQYSWAIPANLKTDLFECHGINCYHESYDESIVKESLENNMPVIVSASDLLIPLDGDIHCFVIDGYCRTRIKYTHDFHFVLDEPPGGLYVMPEDYTTYTYSEPEITAIRINWGWRSQWYQQTPVNDGWYSLTGNWVVNNNGTYDYNHHRKMIYGFSVETY